MSTMGTATEETFTRDEVVAKLKTQYESLRYSANIAAGRRSESYMTRASAVHDCMQMFLDIPEPLAIRGSWQRIYHGERPITIYSDLRPGPWHYFPGRDISTGAQKPALCGVGARQHPRTSSPWHSKFGQQIVPDPAIDGKVCPTCLAACDPRFRPEATSAATYTMEESA